MSDVNWSGRFARNLKQRPDVERRPEELVTCGTIRAMETSAPLERHACRRQARRLRRQLTYVGLAANLIGALVVLALRTTVFAWALTRPLVQPLYRTVVIPAFGAFGVMFGLWYVGG